MIYCFDIDGTICTLREDGKYDLALPFSEAIKEINQLHSTGHKIIFMTARGSVSGKDWTDYTKKQLEDWQVRYDELIMNKKPNADIFIDDKGLNAVDWLQSLSGKRGILAGAFDLIHPGYVRMFRQSKTVCSHLTVALHDDPTLERPSKCKPVQTLDERREILESIRYVDKVVTYTTESELLDLLQSSDYDIRILGDDYRDKSYTGSQLKKEVFFCDRSHGHSTTSLKERIRRSFKEREK